MGSSQEDPRRTCSVPTMIHHQVLPVDPPEPTGFWNFFNGKFACLLSPIKDVCAMYVVRCYILDNELKKQVINV